LEPFVGADEVEAGAAVVDWPETEQRPIKRTKNAPRWRLNIVFILM
jgi:hypothetical protein